ncbi:hypothetical protein LCGC14_2415530 [marine sediment metagenome]|uniref:Uncharacterized protein n=1 Tax=marine sediment metagenome TaxID=412755 RepID=A0A0F9BR90_9ZZZZ
MTKERQIKCRAKDGVFDDESVVRVKIVDSSGNDTEAECLAYGDSVQLQGEKDDVSGEADATLQIYCLQEKNDLAAVVLPQSTFQNGSTVIVRKSELM